MRQLSFMFKNADRYSLILSLIIASLCFEVQATAPKSPREIASEFYGLVVKESPSGLPDARVMRLLRPYLSNSLRSLFEQARKDQAAYMIANPQDKPPNIEGCLFSCSFEGPTRFSAGVYTISDRFAYVAVKQSMEPDGNYEWSDTLILVKENGRWLVWDVRMGCTWPFRMGPTLREMLSGT